MAWNNPNTITSSTKIKDTDESLQGSMDDLESYVNGVSPYSSTTGLTKDFVDKDTIQTISATKNFNEITATKITGDVEGNLTGNVTGDVVGNVTGNLTGDVTGNLSALPTGVIAMWSGLVTEIPNTWLLCDGTNGTPDLRGKFIYGASVDGDINVTGGEANATLVEHTHDITISEDGEHTHNVNGKNKFIGDADRDAVFDYYSDDASTEDGSWYAMSQAGSHSHEVTLSEEGEANIDKNLPPYMKLAYIMKA